MTSGTSARSGTGTGWWWLRMWMRMRQHADGDEVVENFATTRPKNCRKRAHSLLEAVIAAGIFIMVTVALSGVWVMYGRSLAKSGEVVAANALARSVSEGLIANGWVFLEEDLALRSPLPEEDFIVERVVRARRADIKYNVTYEAKLNTGGVILTNEFFTPDLCEVVVTVRWNSTVGANDTSDGYNNDVTYSTIVYKKGMR